MTTATTAQDRANNRLHTLGQTHYTYVPVYALLEAIEAAGWVIPQDQRGMIITSRKGHARIACWYQDTEREQAQDALHRLTGAEKHMPITTKYLNFTWRKMGSGNYEIVAYLS